MIAVYAALAVGWAALARWVVPPLLIEEDPGRIVLALQRYIRNPPAPFVTQDILGAWGEFSGAVLIALAIHLAIVVILRGSDFGLMSVSGSRELPAGRRVRLLLAGVSMVFLVVAVATGACQDYYFYLQMWSEVRLGRDPWFIVPGIFGMGPLNAYGPLFNLMAGLAWVNPLAPKLLFAGSYLLFAVSQVRSFMAGRTNSRLAVAALAALFWNPFPWVEIAIRGHFDILVGLVCLGAIRAVGSSTRYAGRGLAGDGGLAEVYAHRAGAVPRPRSRSDPVSVPAGGRRGDYPRPGAEPRLVGAFDAAPPHVRGDAEVDRAVDLPIHPGALFAAVWLWARRTTINWPRCSCSWPSCARGRGTESGNRTSRRRPWSRWPRCCCSIRMVSRSIKW